MDKDTQLIYETYQQLYEAMSSSEALSRMRGAMAAGHEDLIPDILDLVDVRDRPALAKKAKMLGISHPTFNAVIPPARGGEEYPGTDDVEKLKEADDELSTEVKDDAKTKVHDEVKKAVEKVQKGAAKEISSAEQKKVDDLEALVDKKGEGMSGLDKLQLTLDVAGLASLSPEPIGQVTGAVSDSTNAVISLVRGIGSAASGDMSATKRHGANMALSLLGLVPYVGDAAAAGLKAGKHSLKATNAARRAKNLKDVASPGALKTFGKALAPTKAGTKLRKGANLGREVQKATKAVTGSKKAAKAARGYVKTGKKLAGAKKKAFATKGASTIGRAGLKGDDDSTDIPAGPDVPTGPTIDVPSTVEPAPEENTALISPDHFRQRFARKVAA